MTEKNILLKDGEASLYPVTKASLVQTSDGKNLGNVEANAQVNVIENINFNGVNAQINNKTAYINDAQYSVTKQEIAEAGYSDTYCFTKDGATIGEKINIPKVECYSKSEIDNKLSGLISYIEFEE